MTRYVWRDGAWRNKQTGDVMEAPNRLAVPHVQSDTAAYMSVVSNKMIDGRAARRDDLKRNGCREVDPSEFKIEGCRTEKWAKRLNMPLVDMSEKRLTDAI